MTTFRRDRLSSPHTGPLLLILVAIVVVNGPALTGHVSTNPLLLDAILAHVPGGHLPGQPYIDGNAGYTTQALGHLAALDWLHGHVPWWNPYEGVGAPLAGEMQSAAFFPPTLLLAFSGGLLWMQVLLEVVAGWSTYFLVRRLGVGRSFATAAGVAFGLCGAFAWFAHAPFRPVAFLPLALVGVERALDAARAGRRNGWRLLAVALALSILAGFPETTFIDALFVIGWAALRVLGPARAAWRPAVRKLALGTCIALAIGAPLLVAFLDYLPHATTGPPFAKGTLPTFGLAQVVLPYSFGPIFAFNGSSAGGTHIASLWDSVGGYLSASILAAGLVGLIGRRQRGLRIALGGWILLCLLGTFGFWPVMDVMAAFSDAFTNFRRYADPSWALAAILLAALGLDDIARGLTRRRVLLAGAAIAAVVAGWSAATAWRLLPSGIEMPAQWGPSARLYPVLSLGFALVVLAVLCLGGVVSAQVRRARHAHGRTARTHLARTTLARRRGRFVMAGALCAESMVLFAFPLLSAPAPVALHTGSVAWLKAHLGTDRFTELGPVQANYGSYFSIGEVNTNDLPLPSAWVRYVRRLNPNESPLTFNGVQTLDPAGVSPAEAVSKNEDAFEAIGTRYVVEMANGQDLLGHAFPAPASPAWPAGPRLVYRDRFAEIWELPAPAPLFSLATLHARAGGGPGTAKCTLHWSGTSRAVVHCSHPTVLVRREQWMPGWSATVNGRPVAIRTDRTGPNGLFQAVTLPAGTATVTFTFLPPFEVPAIVIAIVGLLVLIGSFGAEWMRRRRRRRYDGEGPQCRTAVTAGPS